MTYEEKIEALVAEIKKSISSIELTPEAKELTNKLIELGNVQSKAMDELMEVAGLERHSFKDAKEELGLRNPLRHDKRMIRKKFEERVEFVASETRDVDNEPNKLVMWNGGNGDLYMTICPQSHGGGISMRFERSGGCSTSNPKLLSALTDAYYAIAGNFED